MNLYTFVIIIFMIAHHIEAKNAVMDCYRFGHLGLIYPLLHHILVPGQIMTSYTISKTGLI